MLSENINLDNSVASRANSTIGSIGSTSSSRELSLSTVSHPISEHPHGDLLPPFLMLDTAIQMQMQQLQIFHKMLHSKQACNGEDIQRLIWQLEAQALIITQVFSALDVSISQIYESLRQLNLQNLQTISNSKCLPQPASSSLDSGMAVPANALTLAYTQPYQTTLSGIGTKSPQIPSSTSRYPTQLIDFQRNTSVQSIHTATSATSPLSATIQAYYTPTPNRGCPEHPIYMQQYYPESYNYQLPKVSPQITQPYNLPAASENYIEQSARPGLKQTLVPTTTSAFSYPIAAPATKVYIPSSISSVRDQPISPSFPYPNISGFMERSLPGSYIQTSPQSIIPATEFQYNSSQFPQKFLNNNICSEENHIRVNQTKIPILGVKESRYRMLKRKKKLTRTWMVIDPSNHKFTTAESTKKVFLKR